MQNRTKLKELHFKWKGKNRLTLHIFNKIMITLFTLIRYSILAIKKN